VSRKAAELAAAIEEHLRGQFAQEGTLSLGEVATCVGLKTLKAAVAADVPQKTFQRARDMALKRLPAWRLDGQTLIKSD
jgi:hypothetical protein